MNRGTKAGQASSVSGRRALPAALFARWQEDLQNRGAPPPSHAALDRLLDPDTAVVVTGQQPGPWGGPLFSLYKAASAVAMAERLTRERGRPATAVFWVQGDDTDWGEVGWGTLPRPDLSVLRHRFESSVPTRHWVGSAMVAAPPEALEVAAAWKRSETLFHLLPRTEPESLSEGFIRSLLALFGNAGLVPLDARLRELRVAGAPLWSRYLERHEDIATEVAARGRALVAQGDAAPLGDEGVDFGLFLLEGERRLDVDPRSWPAAVRDLLAQGAADRLAPSVLLRAALQDHLLAPAVHVVGATEGAYLRQLQPAYQALEIVAPERIPRMRATLLPRGLLPASQREDILRDPEAWIASRAKEMIPAQARGALETLRRQVITGLHDLAAHRESGDVREILASTGRKMEYELSRVDEVLQRRGRQDLYRAEPRLRNLPEFLRPRRGDQERGLSGATAALLLGDRAPEALLGAARQFLEQWTAGEAHPLILEASDE